MSMLTPPGMGGKYRITGRRFPHMRRPRNPRRVVLAAVAAVAVLGLGGWGTIQLVDVFSGGGSGSPQAARKSADCGRDGHGDTTDARAAGRSAPRELPRPGDITVNVYNATPRSGLAKTTADELKARGFRIGKVGNAPAPYDKNVEGTALLLGSPDDADGAMRVLQEQVGEATVKSDVRKGTDIDLIIGAGFKELRPAPDASRAPAAPHPAPSSPAPSKSAAKC
ncbi:LytR C-terminal domain-containing protein [Streptomyces mobaraensis NBRC 13819 = DSM 40847]|uniref:LytR family transcriptional regulator n=1 Tax=Streptomyces mobaraensis TaxID=35621 RepID=A0A5N5WCX5_STRMB|nr:LytR C-terminal domain-containing protein [Streptomyces mobaraensis]KAB7848556.1 LytR family transcriptional regulator [Streptomyces mobaraensis]QTT74853.1 LytR C-terminal domain-containing protein [Streptomyces mobaraensis NBRC 13819 = DSM 40847]